MSMLKYVCLMCLGDETPSDHDRSYDGKNMALFEVQFNYS